MEEYSLLDAMYSKIEQILKEKQISRRQLAHMAGLAPSTLISAFARKTNLTITTVIKIAAALDITPQELIGPAMHDLKFLESVSSENTEEASAIKSAVFDYLKSATDNAILNYHVDGLETILPYFQKLNKKGRMEAIERIQEMTQLEKYTTPLEDTASED